jgi:hypothetical protein
MGEIETEKNKENLACLIIDDPLLKPKYGCLDYAKLLKAMKDHRFFTEIAFVPWNYRRSDPNIVQLFSDNAEYYALCVHGCNHLGNEFGRGHYEELRALANTAMWRMEQHKKLTGLPYDPVFVFPQGRFSSVAMKALKDQGYFAAFNSTLQATDIEELSDREFQQPATMIYHDFPLFLRRYPKDESQFIKDINMGRPILIVEHHSAFRIGYKMITDLIDRINSLGNVRWASLLHIAEHYLGKKATIFRPSAISYPSLLRSNAKVVLRRFLSEARDNYVETSNLLNKVYKLVRG